MPRRRSFAVCAAVIAAAIGFGWHQYESVPAAFEDAGVETCEALPVVVHLVGEHHGLTMYAGANGPMYTVKDKAGGVVIGCMAEEAMLRQRADLIPPTLGVIRTLHSAQVGYLR